MPFFLSYSGYNISYLKSMQAVHVTYRHVFGLLAIRFSREGDLESTKL